MPQLDPFFWDVRRGSPSPCHYEERWQDWYATVMRRWGIRRILHGEKVQFVLDVGTGDGQMAEWLQKRFGYVVMGIDATDFHATGKMWMFKRLDIETLDRKELPARPDLATAITVLPFTADWKEAVRRMCNSATLVLVVDDLQSPAPPWQQGLSYKRPLTFEDVLAEFKLNGLYLKKHLGVNWLDRRLFFKSPKWLYPLVAVLTVLVDQVVIRVLRPGRCRYQAVLFSRIIRRKK